MSTTTAAGYDWEDADTMGGDELRSCEAWELAGMLSDALRVAASNGQYRAHMEDKARRAAARITYYLDVARYGEAAAVATSNALDSTLSLVRN